MDEQNLQCVSSYCLRSSHRTPRKCPENYSGNNNIRLVECDPVLDTITHSFKDNTSIACKVFDPFILVAQRTTVLFIECLWCIPVIKGHKGRNACCNQVVDEFHVVLKTFFVHGIVAAALGDDAGPVGG